MPFVLVFVGLVVLIAAVRGNEGKLGALLSNDFFGANSFIYWAVAMIAIGALGYVPKLKGLSVAFMSLVLITMTLRNGGLFQKLQQSIQQIGATAGAPGNQDVGTGWGALIPGAAPAGPLAGIAAAGLGALVPQVSVAQPQGSIVQPPGPAVAPASGGVY